METKEIQQKEINHSMEIDGSIMSVLNETRKWTKFLAILGFIGLGILLLMGLFMGTVGILLLMGLFMGTVFSSIIESMPQTTPFPTTMLSFIYIIMAIVFFFPVLYLFNFSDKMKIALYTSNQEALYEAFNNLKRHFKFIGIIIIVVLLIAGTIIIGAGILAAM